MKALSMVLLLLALEPTAFAETCVARAAAVLENRGDEDVDLVYDQLQSFDKKCVAKAVANELKRSGSYLGYALAAKGVASPEVLDGLLDIATTPNFVDGGWPQLIEGIHKNLTPAGITRVITLLRTPETFFRGDRVLAANLLRDAEHGSLALADLAVTAHDRDEGLREASKEAIVAIVMREIAAGRTISVSAKKRAVKQ